MKIGLDISQVVYGTGVSVYLKNLIPALLSQDKKNDYLLFGGSFRRKKEIRKFAQSQSVKAKIISLPPTLADFLWNRLHLLPIEKLIGPIDVFHASDWAQPPAQKAKIVTTVHDLSFLRWPESVNPLVLAVQKRRLAWVKKEAAVIIAVSQATKKEIIALLGIPEKKIKVIPEALPQDVLNFSPTNPNDLQKRFQINQPYLFAYGSAAPRKNIDRIISAFELLRKEIDYQLVVVGEYQPRQKIPQNVVLTGFLPRQEMLTLFSQAEALVYPSTYEGFGLPVLEAFALKVPVVTSYLSSLPEVAGAAAVLVDPLKPQAIAQGIKKALKEKEKLIQAGLEQVKKFSWAKTAQLTLKVYQGVR